MRYFLQLICCLSLLCFGCVPKETSIDPRITDALTHKATLEKVYSDSNIGYVHWKNGVNAEIEYHPEHGLTTIKFNDGLLAFLSVIDNTLYLDLTPDGDGEPAFKTQCKTPANTLQEKYYAIIKENAVNLNEVMKQVQDFSDYVQSKTKIYRSSDEVLKEQQKNKQ